MKNVLITGGTGSLGSALVKAWYNKYNITVLSRDPHKQARMAMQYPKVRFVLADICDQEAVKRACHGQDTLVHAAALKQVNLGQMHPVEFSRVNVQGTETVARAWDQWLTRFGISTATGAVKLYPHRPKQALFISTDKAVQPINTYGKSKALAESVALNAGFSCLRYGNVVDSNGSFIQVWQRQQEQGLPIKVRQPSPTRFAMTLDDAVQLVEDVFELETIDPAVYIPHSLPAFTVADVAKAYVTDFDLEPLLPGEKQHEILLAQGEYATKAGERLARVQLGYEVGMSRERFSSETAPRMTGKEVLDWLSS